MVKPNIPAPGDIWWLDMSPFTGKEQAGRHPGLIISGFVFNRATGFAVVAPISTVANAARNSNFAVTLSGAGTETTGMIQVDQVRSLDWRKRGATERKERVPDHILREVLERYAPIVGLGLLEPDVVEDDQ